MSRRAWLIAEREFRTYATTLSFWIALALAPLLLGGGLLLAQSSGHSAAAHATLTVSKTSAGALVARFSPDFPLSGAARGEIARLLQREAGAQVRVESAPAPGAPDAARAARFVLALILWLTLTGSLGMLLQATVRERTNRALESLLAAAGAWDIVLGKLLGVGAVSVLVVAVWLASSGAVGLLAGASSGAVAGLLHALAEPVRLLKAGAVYLLGYAFYGLLTIAVGARARDNADAQNLARPMFALLLAVFFAMLTMSGSVSPALAWLKLVPPFAPFLLLIDDSFGAREVLAVGLLLASAAAAGVVAVRSLQLGPAKGAAPKRRREDERD